jgi:hypothetical protein
MTGRKCSIAASQGTDKVEGGIYAEHVGEAVPIKVRGDELPIDIGGGRNYLVP